MLSPIIIAGLIIGFYMAWNIGANDLANAMGTIFGSGALEFKQIVIIASILNVSGALFFGSRVVGTVAHGIVSEMTPLAALSGLLGAGIFITLASWSKMPVSTTHSIIGALLGFGLVSGGVESIHWMTVGKVILSWVISPVAGIGMGYLMYKFIRKGGLEKLKDRHKGEKLYHLPHILSSSYEAFSHGSNDVANAIALVGVIFAGGLGANEVLEIPSWILLFGGVGIAIGITTFGKRVMSTIGKRITMMSYSRGYAAEFSAASIVLIASYFGMPVSTTHTSVGTVAGVGIGRGRENVNLKTLGKVTISWLLTLPLAGLFCVGIYKTLILVS